MNNIIESNKVRLGLEMTLEASPQKLKTYGYDT